MDVRSSMIENIKAFINQSDAEISQKIQPYINYYKGLNATVSFGFGQFAYVTWITFSGDQQSTTDGIYPGILYYRLRGLVILSYGISATNKPKLTWDIDSSVITIEEFFKRKGVNTKEKDIAKYHESLIYKVFDVNNFDYAELVDSLDSLILKYKYCLRKNGLKEEAEFVPSRMRTDKQLYYNPDFELEEKPDLMVKDIEPQLWTNSEMQSNSLQRTVSDYGAILKEMYYTAPSGKQVAAIFLFGIKYGTEIVDKYKAKEIITASGISESYEVELNKAYNLYRLMKDENLNPFKKDAVKADVIKKPIDQPLQQIYYGAPGTGKSHGIDKIVRGIYSDETVREENVVRTTFHPDSDYASFVGCYKPTMISPKEIGYQFVPQSFMLAYTKAWEDLSKPIFLVIEEINRGNCAQIFGDLFQLLDRNDNGYSSYSINADQDLQKYLEGYFLVSVDANAPASVRNGKKLCLPPNLYVWATMNTSDQSLFPIDSAFKRRWDWKYMPIDTKKESWSIKVNGQSYDWGSFLEKVNKEIEDTTSSEDKKLGFYFCKAKDGVISADRFVSKVLFYVYNDVFKDYGLDRSFLKEKIGDKETVISFQSFYKSENEIDEAQVEKILKNLGVNEGQSSLEHSQDTEADETFASTELQSKLYRFWQEYNKAREKNLPYKEIYGVRAASNTGGMDLSFGSSLYWPYLKATFTKSFVRCGIWIGVSDRNKEIYDAFHAHEEEINLLMGEKMNFGETKKTYYFSTTKSIDLQDESNWPEAYDWLMNMAIKLKEVKDKFGI